MWNAYETHSLKSINIMSILNTSRSPLQQPYMQILNTADHYYSDPVSIIAKSNMATYVIVDYSKRSISTVLLYLYYFQF